MDDETPDLKLATIDDLVLYGPLFRLGIQFEERLDVSDWDAVESIVKEMLSLLQSRRRSSDERMS